MIKRIVSGDNLMVIIIPHDFHKEGVEFLTPSDLSQQLGNMKQLIGKRKAWYRLS